jgi:hypothetical protein
MNEKYKSFYPSDKFDFIHHLKYECPNHEGLSIHVLFINMMKSTINRLYFESWLNFENNLKQQFDIFF